MTTVEIRHFHLFAGLGGGAAGFNRASPRVGRLQGTFRCLGGIDVIPAAVADFSQRFAGVPGTLLDLFDREQYRAFHGTEPPADWREATPADIRRAASGERPHIVFTSPPCKGFSGLLGERASRSVRYQALNRLTVRGIWLALEAWADDPPEFVLLENVPRIATRGRQMLDQITSLLGAYGYAVAETTHDCGELGALAQSRKRFLLVARHIGKVPPFLHEPRTRPLRAVGDVLWRMPLPGDIDAGGPMHRVPALQWRTWVRLALIEAGSDWRSLERHRVVNGVLADLGIAPERDWHSAVLGVRRWDAPAGTVTGSAGPTTGSFSVADPRFAARGEYGQYGVLRWSEPTGAVIGVKSPGQGRFSVADPRRVGGGFGGKYVVTSWDGHAGCVISGSTTGQGAFAIADPRTGMDRKRGDHYLTGGHYGVLPWGAASGAVSAAACHDNGRWSVADPRIGASGDQAKDPTQPAADDRLVAVIRAEDGTWHRPFTTLELAALQGLVEPEGYLELDGLSDTAWRERIGNAVPPPAAQAIAEVMGTTLLLAWSGETFVLSDQPIWVQPIATAAAVDVGDVACG